MADLSAFVPRSLWPLAAQAFRGGTAFVRASGSLLFCDVAGFTALTDALAVMGREGAEELTHLLNAYFARTVGIVEDHGGDVLRFGGDAMTILFPGDEGERALAAAFAMTHAMDEFASLETRAGTFGLAMKAGAARGEVLLGFVGEGEGKADFYAAGPPLAWCAEAEHHARPGQVVAHATLSGVLPPKERRAASAGGFAVLSGRGASRTTLPSSPSVATPPPLDLGKMLPPFLEAYGPGGLSGEHRGVAVLFVAFSDPLLDALEAGRPVPGGDGAVHGRIGELHARFRQTAERHGGSLNKLDMGDKGHKALLFFGSPQALEHREEAAARAALDLRDHTPWPEGVRLRMGLTSAPLFVGPLGAESRREFTGMGGGINLAARLMQAAGAGEIYVGEGAAAALAGAFRFEALPPLHLKGKAKPVKASRLLAAMDEVSSAGSGPLVGRQKILRRLAHYLERGEGGPLALVGGPGMGKTALVEWACDRLRKRGCFVRVPLGPHSAYHPFAAWRGPLRALLRVQRGDPPERLREALAKALRHEPPGYRPLLHPMLDLKPEETPELQNLGPKERKDLTFAILNRLARTAGSRCLIVDNLHWADPASLEFLGFLLSDPEPLDLRVVVTFRPGSEAAERAARRLERVDLQPLTEREVAALLTGPHRLLEPERPVLEWFTHRARGNPGAVAALLTAVDASGLIQRGPWGARIDGDRLFKTAFPETLEGLYLAPVDRLSPRERKVLQQASVLGTSVSVNLLRLVTGMESAALAETLAVLEARHLLLPDSWGIRPYVRFADAMLRDAVYEAAPFEVKRRVHAGIARTLEAEGGSSPKLWPVLARHFRAAGEERLARKYHRLAGRDAYARADNVSAVSHFLEWMKGFSGEDGEIDDALSALELFKDLGKWPEYAQLLEKFGELGLSLPPAHRTRLLTHQARLKARNGDFQGAEALLQESLRLGRGANDPSAEARALLNLVGLVYGPRDQLATAEKLLRKTLSLRLPASDRPYIAVGWMNLGLVLKHRGRLREALRSLERAYRVLPEGRAAYIQVALALNLCSLSYERGCLAEALRWGRKGLGIAERFALRQYLPHAHLEMANGLLSQGRLRSAAAHIQRALALSRFLEEKGLEARCHQMLQRLHLAGGRLDQAYDCMVKALRLYMDEGDGRSLRLALLEVASFFAALNHREGLSELLEDEGIPLALVRLPGDPHSEAVAAFALHLASGGDPNRLQEHVERFERTWRSDRLEGYLLCAEAALAAGAPTAAVTAARKARRAWRSFPDWFYGVRLAALECSLTDRWRIPPALEPSLRRKLGGPWGLRLLCEAALQAGGRPPSSDLRAAAMRRLRLVRGSSLPWQWGALLRLGRIGQFSSGPPGPASKARR